MLMVMLIVLLFFRETLSRSKNQLSRNMSISTLVLIEPNFVGIFLDNFFYTSSTKIQILNRLFIVKEK